MAVQIMAGEVRRWSPPTKFRTVPIAVEAAHAFSANLEAAAGGPGCIWCTEGIPGKPRAHQRKSEQKELYCVAARACSMSGGEPMKPDRYRLYGAECLRLAKLASNVGDRLLLLHMADAWRRLAERSETQPDKKTSATGHEWW
jgi:hypothetical protein